jgi:UMF1 family MFS transporter
MSLVIYDSMLNDVTVEERMDEVSSYGYAWGYIGSCIPFIIAMVAYILSGGLSEDLMWFSPQVGKIIGYTVTGLWWFAVTVPLIKNYKQVNYTEAEHGAIAKVFSKIGATLKKIATQDKKVLFFLIAFFLYIDGVGTIIDNCINIGTDLGLPTVGQVVFLLATQVVAFGGSLVFARLSRKLNTVTLILICIFGYFCVCLYALTLHTLIDFGILAFGVGCFQGSIQSLSRSYFSKIIPPENSGEYFGIYDIFSKGASFLGSAVIAWVKLAGGTINIAVASLAVFFALGFLFLKIADKQPSSREAANID